MNLLSPALRLVNALRFSKKFALLLLLSLAPLAVLVSALVMEHRATIDTAEQEKRGLAVHRQLMQIHHALVALQNAGSEQLRPELDGLQRQFDAMGPTLADGDEFAIGGEVTSLRKAVGADPSRVQAKVRQSGPDWLNHSANIVYANGMRSGLMLDPESSSFILIELLVQRLPVAVNSLGRWHGELFADSRSPSLDGMARDAELQWALIERNLAQFSTSDKPLAARLQPPAKAISRRLASLRGMLASQQAAGSVLPGPIADEIQRLLVESQGFQTLLEQQVETLLDARIQRTHQTIWETATLLVLALSVTVYLGLATYLALKHGLNALGLAAIALEQNDLRHDVHIESRDELGEIGERFNHMLASVRQTLNEVQDAAGQVAQSSRDLARSVAEAREVLGGQQRQTDLVATAITQMAATITEVASNAEQAAAAAQHAIDASHSGGEVMGKTLDNIGAMAGSIDTAAGIVQQLAEDALAINSVSEVIRSIAEQTNLLALNAAIEAARAGEAGRGFAVVADEVRILAGRTAQSTQEIQKTIETLQSGVHAAVSAIVENKSLAHQGTEDASGAGSALSTINSAISTIAEMNGQIASAAEEQHYVSEDINRNTCQIRDGGQRIIQSIETDLAAARELSVVAQQLQASVQRFRLAREGMHPGNEPDEKPELRPAPSLA